MRPFVVALLSTLLLTSRHGFAFQSHSTTAAVSARLLTTSHRPSFAVAVIHPPPTSLVSGSRRTRSIALHLSSVAANDNEEDNGDVSSSSSLEERTAAVVGGGGGGGGGGTATIPNEIFNLVKSIALQ